MKNLKHALAILAATTALAAPVVAMDLGQAMGALNNAKNSGLVGEQVNGYLGVIKNQNGAADVARLINAARKAEYQKLASSNGISLQDVEILAGQKSQRKTAAGQWIQVNGQWRRK